MKLGKADITYTEGLAYTEIYSPPELLSEQNKVKHLS